MRLTTRVLHTIGTLSLRRQIDQTLKRAKVALAVFIAVCVIAFLSLIVIASYFLIHLIQGR